MRTSIIPVIGSLESRLNPYSFTYTSGFQTFFFSGSHFRNENLLGPRQILCNKKYIKKTEIGLKGDNRIFEVRTLSLITVSFNLMILVTIFSILTIMQKYHNDKISQ